MTKKKTNKLLTDTIFSGIPPQVSKGATFPEQIPSTDKAVITDKSIIPPYSTIKNNNSVSESNPITPYYILSTGEAAYSFGVGLFSSDIYTYTLTSDYKFKFVQLFLQCDDTNKTWLKMEVRIKRGGTDIFETGLLFAPADRTGTDFKPLYDIVFKKDDVLYVKLRGTCTVGTLAGFAQAIFTTEKI